MKRFKNTTNADITHTATGQNFLANSYTEVAESNVAGLADAETFDHFCNGAIVFNDGTTDYTDPARGWDLFRGAPQMFQSDSESAQIVRVKAAPAGWTFQARAISFKLSTLNSVRNDKPDGTGWGDATIKFYDSNNNELTTQLGCDTQCVKTVMDWEPTYDYEIVGGILRLFSAISSAVDFWIVAVPDIPENQGGSKIMLNHLDLKFDTTFQVDGRVTKRMNYSATYHTNKLRFILKHPAGFKCDLQAIYEHFKA